MPGLQQVLSESHPVFRFVVEIDGERQGAFTECSLPSIDWEVEDLKEGGLNVFVHALPGQRRSARLTLKNGLGKNKMYAWYLQGMKEQFQRKSLTIILLDAKGSEVMGWHIEDAYPIRWNGPQLRPDDNTIAIQTLEIACGEIDVT